MNQGVVYEPGGGVRPGGGVHTVQKRPGRPCRLRPATHGSGLTVHSVTVHSVTVHSVTAHQEPEDYHQVVPWSLGTITRLFPGL